MLRTSLERSLNQLTGLFFFSIRHTERMRKALFFKKNMKRMPWVCQRRKGVVMYTIAGDIQCSHSFRPSQPRRLRTTPIHNEGLC